MVKAQTIQRVATPTAILVGLAEPLATICTDALADGGLRVLRVGHVAAACERIPVVMPQLVVASTTLRPEDTDMLVDRCVAVGAEVINVAPDAKIDAALKTMLKDAANMALIRSLRRGG
ncbi:MAG: hypothetical protein JWP87_1780 [Labilithrix sp.]|nr:hypothetical protein [Labilithrix sp.]